MKFIEMNFVENAWLKIVDKIEKKVSDIGNNVQLWFYFGNVWRGYDKKGCLPPTNLNFILSSDKEIYILANRIWKRFILASNLWLISLSIHNLEQRNMNEISQILSLDEDIFESLYILSGLVKIESVLSIMTKVLENIACENQGHWDRVRNLAVSIGKQLNLSDQELFDLEIAALLHDIGKVTLPKDLLEENRALTPAERKHIESHPLLGAAIVREMAGFERIAEYIQNHHEYPDGSGYPRGLKDPDIPIISLIVGTAEAFDAMTHYRPYAEPKTYKQSLNEMIKSGKYDHRVLWALQSVLKKIGILESTPIKYKSESLGSAEI